MEFTHGYFCPGWLFIIKKPKPQIDEKVLRQYQNFSTRLPYANKKVEEVSFLWVKLNIVQHKACPINYNS